GVAILALVPESPDWREATREAAPPTPLRELFRPPLLWVTLLGIALGAVPVVGTAANANWTVPWTDEVAGRHAQEAGRERGTDDKALTMMTRNGGAIIGSFLGGVIASVAGRRLTYFLISLGSFGLSCLVFGRLNPLDPWFQPAVFLFGLVGVTYFGWLPLFL